MTRRSLLSVLLCVPLIAVCLSGRRGMAAPDGESLAEDEAAVGRSIAELSSDSRGIREAAAARLRAIVARYPSGTSNLRDKDAGKAAWQTKIEQTHPGMAEADVETILPPMKGAMDGMEMGEGQSHNKTYRLDDHWLVSLWYANSGGLLGKPELRRSERQVWTACPPHFTGQWTTWYVNGQQAEELALRDGKFDGMLTCFWDNGGKCYEQHYVMGVAEGADTGWYASGKLSYTAQYKHGQQDGVWTHWYESGQKLTEAHFKNGKNDGLQAEWYENGQMKFEMNYREGIENGLNAAWTDKGVVEYSHQMKDGNVVD